MTRARAHELVRYCGLGGARRIRHRDRPGLAAAAEEPRTFALVGSLQSELGCSDPPRRLAARVRRDRAHRHRHARVYAAEFTVPAGSYEYKVAVNDALGRGLRPERRRRQHPARPSPATPPVRVIFDDNTQPRRPRGRSASRAATTRHPTPRSSPTPSARPGSDEQFYFVMTDRFANGDAVERHGRPRRRPPHDRLRPDRQGLLQRRRPRRPARAARLHRGPRHDGDLAHPELQEPAGAGRRARTRAPATTATGSPTSRRSTRTSAPTPSSRRSSPTRTPAASRSTSTSSRTTRPTSSTTHEGAVRLHRPGDAPRTATPTAPRSTRPTTPGTEHASPRSTPATSFPYTPDGDRRGRRPSRCPAWLNDPTLYHNRGNSTWAGESVTYGDFVGLDDLMTEHPTVVDGFVDVYKALDRPRHRRLPHRHRQARELRVLGAVVDRGARLRARRRASPTSSCSARSTTPTR